MIIPITFHPASSRPTPKLPPALARLSHDEVVLIELQGTLAVECTEPRERDGRLVGQLRVNDSTGMGTDLPSATLVIGNHLLEGKVATLAKPLAVLTRVPAPGPPVQSRGKQVLDGDGMEEGGNGEDEDEDMDEMDEMKLHQSGSAPVVGWDVAAIVKRKIVFSKRPTPITGTAVLGTGGRKIG